MYDFTDAEHDMSGEVTLASPVTSVVCSSTSSRAISATATSANATLASASSINTILTSATSSMTSDSVTTSLNATLTNVTTTFTSATSTTSMPAFPFRNTSSPDDIDSDVLPYPTVNVVKQTTKEDKS